MRFVKHFSLFLAPTFTSSAISFLMVPIVTFVIGPEDFGIFALMSPLTTLGITLAVAGAGAVCSTHFPVLGPTERKRLLSTSLGISLSVGIAFASGCVLVWPIVTQFLQGYAAVRWVGLLLSLATLILNIPWLIAQEVITLERKAHAYAAITTCSILANSVATILGLYVWKLGVMALFLGSAVTGVAVCIGALWVLRPYIGCNLSWQWARRIFALGPANLAGNLAEGLQINIERNLLLSYFGMRSLGLYAHAQAYRMMGHQVLKAAARTVWPVTLAEARDGESDFFQTKAVWSAFYIGITAIGVLFAVLGKYIVAILTHGRFTEAYTLVPWWMVFLLFLNGAKPQTGIMFVSGEVNRYFWLLVGSYLPWLVLFAILAPQFGLIGAIAAMIGQQAVFRLSVQRLARRYRESRPSDRWVFVGSVIIVGVWVLAGQFNLDFVPSCVLFFALSLFLLVIGSQALRTFFSRMNGWPRSCVVVTATKDGRSW